MAARTTEDRPRTTLAIGVATELIGVPRQRDPDFPGLVVDIGRRLAVRPPERGSAPEAATLPARASPER
jgi:hypothetical protein